MDSFSDVTSFVASPGNADSLFRMAQYLLRVLATRSKSDLASDLMGVVGAIDSARTANRGVGCLEAIDGLLVLLAGPKGHYSARHTLVLLQHLSSSSSLLQAVQGLHS